MSKVNISIELWLQYGKPSRLLVLINRDHTLVMCKEVNHFVGHFNTHEIIQNGQLQQSMRIWAMELIETFGILPPKENQCTYSYLLRLNNMTCQIVISVITSHTGEWDMNVPLNSEVKFDYSLPTTYHIREVLGG